MARPTIQKSGEKPGEKPGLQARRSLRKIRIPRTLFMRTMLIIVTPLLIVQAIAAYVFFSAQWSVLSQRLLNGMASEVATLVELAEQFPDLRDSALDLVVNNNWLYLEILQRASFTGPMVSDNHLARTFAAKLAERFDLPFVLRMGYRERNAEVLALLGDGAVIRISFPRKRIYHPVFYVFVPWMLGSSAVVLTVAVLLMRGQLRAVRRLARAAEALGAGKDIKGFHPEGAIEIRMAARALLSMRARLLQEVNTQKTMLAGISHDLRTPLTRMRLQASLLDGSEKQGLEQDIIEMEALIDQYLAFVRGDTPISKESADLVLLVRKALAARPEPCAAPVRLPAGMETIPIELDSAKMLRCLDNLIANAERFARGFAITLGVNKDGVSILIDDDGPGIPPKERERVFKPFQRIEHSRNRKLGGSGLGLNIAAQVINLHDGLIELGDSPMGGLQVRVWLPKEPDSTAL